MTVEVKLRLGSEVGGRAQGRGKGVLGRGTGI